MENAGPPSGGSDGDFPGRLPLATMQWMRQVGIYINGGRRGTPPGPPPHIASDVAGVGAVAVTPSASLPAPVSAPVVVAPPPLPQQLPVASTTAAGPAVAVRQYGTLAATLFKANRAYWAHSQDIWYDLRHHSANIQVKGTAYQPTGVVPTSNEEANRNLGNLRRGARFNELAYQRYNKLSAADRAYLGSFLPYGRVEGGGCMESWR